MVKKGNRHIEFARYVKKKVPGKAIGKEAWTIGANIPRANKFSAEEIDRGLGFIYFSKLLAGIQKCVVSKIRLRNGEVYDVRSLAEYLKVKPDTLVKIIRPHSFMLNYEYGHVDFTMQSPISRQNEAMIDIIAPKLEEELLHACVVHLETVDIEEMNPEFTEFRKMLQEKHGAEWMMHGDELTWPILVEILKK